VASANSALRSGLAASRSRRRTFGSVRVDAIEELHPFGQVRERGADEKVIVVRHQAVRVTDPFESRNHPGRETEELKTIAVRQEDLLASIPATGDLVESSFILDP